ncbi:MAG: EcsC family protein [Burkholderiales bacterium]
MPLSANDLNDLKRAKALLENPGLAAKITNLLGSPLEKGLARLPAKISDGVQKAAHASLMKATNVAVRSLDSSIKPESSDGFHKIAATISGAAGGMFGLAALAIELPVSTIIMLRSISDIARSEGEDISDMDTKLSCLSVFALGGKSVSDDASETGYFAARTAMASAVSEAAKYLARKGAVDASAPAVVRLISLIASRFGIVVSEKAAAQAVPIIGAVAGAMINSIFIDHFQDMARGHFIVRRLERKYGEDVVQLAYKEA